MEDSDTSFPLEEVLIFIIMALVRLEVLESQTELKLAWGELIL